MYISVRCADKMHAGAYQRKHKVDNIYCSKPAYKSAVFDKVDVDIPGEYTIAPNIVAYEYGNRSHYSRDIIDQWSESINMA